MSATNKDEISELEKEMAELEYHLSNEYDESNYRKIKHDIQELKDRIQELKGE